MTREEAIILIERAANELREMMKTITMPTSAAEQLQQEIDAHEIAISALRQQEHPQWISVNDRMPAQTDPAQKVLFIKKTGGVFIGCYYKATDYDKFSGWYAMGIRIDNVTHWMPLPEPPENSFGKKCCPDQKEGDY